MKNYIISTVIGAAVIEFVSEFLPLRAASPLRKYLRYIIALVLALSIITPITNLLGTGGTELFFDFEKSFTPSENTLAYSYLYITDYGVYESDEQGSKLSENTVFCDLYIRDCARSVSAKVKEELTSKFSLEKGKISVDVALDVRELESIDIICIRVGGVNGYLARDLRDYLTNLLGCAVYTE